MVSDLILLHVFYIEVFSSSLVDNEKKKKKFVLDEGPTQGLDDTTIMVSIKLNIPLFFQDQIEHFI